MLIHRMNEEECLSLLARSSLGRLGCARDNQPYVVPIYFACHERHLYAFSTVGQKIEWMRANPHICLEADEITSHYEWMSVVVFGHYEELPDTPECEQERKLAYELLQQRAKWWQPAFVASAEHNAAESLAPIFFRIHIDQVTGHRGLLDAVEAATLSSPEPTTEHESRLLKLLRRARIT